MGKLNTQVSICHRYFVHLIRPQFTMTSNEWNKISEHPQHLVKILPGLEPFNTIDLRLRHDDQMLMKLFRSCNRWLWSICIAEKQEIHNLSRFIMVLKPHITHLIYYLQESYTKNDVLQFYNALHYLENKVDSTRLLNVTSVCNIVPEIKMLALKTMILEITVTKHHTDKEMDEVDETLKVTARKHDSFIRILWTSGKLRTFGKLPTF